jgi:dynein light intermediate chain 2
MDLWEIVRTDPEVSAQGKSGGEDSSTLLVVGDGGSGKSSLIQMFLKPNSNREPKSTFALEYNFARRKNAGAGGKSVAHIWELGGDIKESALLGIPLSTTNLPSAAVMIVVDLSQPQNVLTSAQRWVQLVREHIQAKMGEIKSTNVELASKMKESAKKRYGEEHEDNTRVRPCEVPIIIVANKFDTFRAKPSADRRAMMQALRFLAHYHGASLIATSRADSSHRDSFRSLMNTVAFGAGQKSSREVGSDKPTQVTVGKDSFSAILLATGTGKTADEDGKSQFASSDADLEAFVGGNGIRKDCWVRFHEVLTASFGAADASAGVSAMPAATTNSDGSADGGEEDGSGANGGTGDSNEYPEADIDEARAAMDLKLDQYIVDVERRERLNASSELEADVAAAGSGSESSARDEGKMDDDSRRRK